MSSAANQQQPPSLMNDSCHSMATANDDAKAHSKGDASFWPSDTELMAAKPI